LASEGGLSWQAADLARRAKLGLLRHLISERTPEPGKPVTRVWQHAALKLLPPRPGKRDKEWPALPPGNGVEVGVAHVAGDGREADVNAEFARPAVDAPLLALRAQVPPFR
jgi:hypothetical protein